jgi:S1-C subfamily serine protease
MRKKLALILLAILMVANGVLWTPIVQEEYFPTEVQMIELKMQSVVKVLIDGYPNYPASGFYIGNGIVVTAGHVVDVDPNTVEFENGAEYRILKTIRHPDYDCGFLLIDDVDHPALDFDLDGQVRGETVFILGNPSTLTFCVSRGIISSIKQTCNNFFGKVVLIQTDAFAAAGNSGSCVLDADGEVVGILVGGRGGSGNICFVVPTSAVLKALEIAELEI